MNIRGKIVWVSDIQSIPKKDGTMFQKREAVVETTGNKYANSLHFEITGEDVNHQFMMQGQEVDVEYNMTAVEYNGKFYNRARAWKITLVQKSS